MARTLVPIKVKIGLKKNGQAKYPDFNSLGVVKDSEMDWSHYIDVHGIGWHYDKCCGHEVDVPDSPSGIQYGLLCLPASFVDQALLAFPDDIQELTEAECEDFYDNHAHAHQSDELIDLESLQAIKTKEDLGIDVTEEKAKALDLNDPYPGIKVNHKKTWVQYKSLAGVTLAKGRG